MPLPPNQYYIRFTVEYPKDVPLPEKMKQQYKQMLKACEDETMDGVRVYEGDGFDYYAIVDCWSANAAISQLSESLGWYSLALSDVTRINQINQ